MTQPRIPLPALSELDPHVIEQLERRPPVHLYRMMAYAPGLLEPFMSMVMANFDQLSLPPALREALILRVGQHHRSEYEIYHHRIKAREAGLTDQEIATLLDPSSPPLNWEKDRRTAIEFVDRLLEGRDLDKALVGELVDAFGYRGYVEISALTGFYRMVATFLEATNLQPECVRVI
ncbi:carboxymuconolactone decarboxylase family protein [Hydrogenophaga sp.]|uniref:carboxymuconolactone decarboxylase family protein n=1 Tax=Hydrogenophaga sp. TaxID=1904254 RepID=UPI003D0BEB36